MPPPRNVLTDTTPSEITPVRGRDQDVFVPARSWRGKVPPELAKEIAGLRRYDARIGDALKDAATSQRFLVSPTSVLDDLKIPLSEGLRGRLSGRTGMDVLATPHRLRLPGNPVISPDVNVRIQEKSDETPGLPSPGGLVRLWNLFPNLFKPTGALDHGYPVVYEITKTCIHDLITQWFDRGPLANMIDGITQQVTDPVLQGAIKLADLAYQDFDLDLDLGMPEGQTTSYPDVMTITLRVPRPDSNATPSTGTVSVSILLRLAASVVVDHTDPQKEEFYLDLAHCLADCEATLTVANLPAVGTQVVDLSSSFTAFLKEKYPQIKVFFDVPVDRSGRSELKPTQVDVRIIDDPTSSDCDAIVLLLSFSDMGPGNRNTFTQSFISSGSGLVVDFNWLRAKILPGLEKALSLPTPIDRASGFWSGQAPIAGGDGAVLTALALGVLPGTRDITVLVVVSKSGDCYSATASMSGALSLYVDQGEFVFKPPQFSTPSVNIDIPWYCYLLSIVVGGILGGIIFTEIGTIVGAIVAPLLLDSIQGVAEGTIQRVIETVNTTVQSETAGIQQIDLGNLKTVLQYASIDDLLALHNVDISDSLPALREATSFIPNGGYLDFATGQIAPVSGSAGHVAWVGAGSSRVLMSQGRTALALLGNRDPGCVTRYQLYQCGFSTGQRFTLAQLAAWDGHQYQPNGLVYAARTADGHYARFTLTDIADDGLWLHYKTYPREVGEKVVVPTVDLRGQFSPKLIHTIGTDPKPAFQSMAGKVAGKWGGWFDANAHWYNEGIFYPNWIGFKDPLSLSWKVQGQALAGQSGTVAVNGVSFHYETYGGQLKLMLDPIVIVDVEVEADVRDGDGHQASATLTARTVEGGIGRIVGGATTPGGVVTPLGDYIVAYKEHVGPWTEVDPASVADRGYRTDRAAPERVGPVG